MKQQVKNTSVKRRKWFKIKYCISCGGESNHLKCDLCLKQGYEKRFCVTCGKELDREGLICIRCDAKKKRKCARIYAREYYSTHGHKPRSKEQILKEILKRETKRPSCTFSKNCYCSNSNFSFRGTLTRCEFKDNRKLCPCFKPSEPELLDFIENKKKILDSMKGGDKEDGKKQIEVRQT